MFDSLRYLDWQVVSALVDYGTAHRWFSFLAYLAAEWLVVAFPAVLFFLWREPQPRSAHYSNRKAVVLALLAIVFALALKTLVAYFLYRDRPFVAHPELVALPLRVDPASFPSSHTMLAFAIAGSLWLSRVRVVGVVMLGCALLVAIGRVATGVHYPSDVIAGAVFGLLTAWSLHRESSSLKRYLPNE